MLCESGLVLLCLALPLLPTFTAGLARAPQNAGLWGDG